MTFNMKPILPLIFLVFISIESKPVSESNVTKREADGDLFPDWVPFKNKHGDQLGEFVQVEPKKPKKRLALPFNFVLRAVAEPEVEDYYEKGQGDGDSEDYYEKHEWSDTNRLPPVKPQVNHTEISDIDGVVGIITKPNPHVIKEDTKSKSSESVESVDKEDDEKSLKIEVVEPEGEKEKKPKVVDYSDYEDVSSEKKPTSLEEQKEREQKEIEQKENEEKKAKILSAVDELKQRHVLEQKAIYEKSREEAMQKEERDRDIGESLENDKYKQRIYKKTDYEDYDEKLTNLEDKYKINPLIKRGSTAKPRTTKSKSKKTKELESGKLSVFRNPSVYMIYDDEGSTETTKTSEETTESSTPTQTRHRYSAKMTTPKVQSDESERISLVPDENELKEGEPTLFFPKRRKNKRKRKNKTTTAKPEADSYVAETHQDKTLKDLVHSEIDGSGKEPTGFTLPSAIETTGPTGSEPTANDSDTGPSANSKEVTPGTGESGPTATGPSGSNGSSETGPSAAGDSALSAASAPSAVTDALPAPSDHKKAEKKHENAEFEKGGEREHHSEHHSEHGESGKKAYEGEHKDSETKKGHHDKEDHVGSYHDHGGHDEKHHNEKEHYGHHHHEEHGKKHAKYEESGKHSKGHSTKGSHDIHKKEEYEKKVEFFEEEGDSAEEEKHGGHNHERAHKSGGGYKKDGLNAGYHEHAKGDSGHVHKGGFGQAHKGHKLAEGHDSHGKHGSAVHHKDLKESGKKWIYHHGSPAKNANLIVIDRRADQLYHGPQYYG